MSIIIRNLSFIRTVLWNKNILINKPLNKSDYQINICHIVLKIELSYNIYRYL